MARITEKYEVVRRLASSGMAEVHLARTRGPAGIERLVVVKRLLPDLADDRNFAGMFLDEARLAVALSHPHIVQVFDVGEDDGSIFYTMEFMHGRDLRMVVQRAARAGVRVPLGVACSVVLAMCEALEYAHELKGAGGEALGIVHRDVSPHNVFVRYDGVVKVLDFGIAKAANRVDRTATGVLKGKFGYMSPEQCLAQPLDRRSDVYCIAVVLYELTTGRRLFSGNSEYEILKQVVETDPSPPTRHEPGYPSELEAVVLCGLVRDRAARYASAALLGGDLESAARQLGLDLSQRAVAEFMQLLFGDDLAAPLTEASPALAIPHPPLGETDAGVDEPTRRRPLQAPLAEETKSTVVTETLRRSDTKFRWRAPAVLGAVLVLLTAAFVVTGFGVGRGERQSETESRLGSATEAEVLPGPSPLETKPGSDEPAPGAPPSESPSPTSRPYLSPSPSVEPRRPPAPRRAPAAVKRSPQGRPDPDAPLPHP